MATTASSAFDAPEAFSLKWRNDFDSSLDQDFNFKIVRFPVGWEIPDPWRAPAARLILEQWKREDFQDGVLQSHSSRFPEFTFRQVEKRHSLVDWLHAWTIGPNSVGLWRYLHAHAQKYDCVIGGYFPFSTSRVASLAAKRASRPFFLAPLYHSEDRHHYFKHLFATLRDSAGVICETSNAQEVFQLLAPAVPCLEAGIGVKEEYLSGPTGDAPTWLTDLQKQNKQLLLYVGRKEESKNYRQLLEVLRLLNDPSVILVMIGKDIDHGPLDHPNILLLEQVNDQDLHWAYQACDIFVFPSLKESFGIVILEAWAAQKPVIGHRQCAAVSSLIRAGFNGLLCDGTEDWLATIKLLLGDKDRRKSLGSNGRDTLINQYTWKIVGEKISGFIETHIRRDRVQEKPPLSSTSQSSEEIL